MKMLRLSAPMPWYGGKGRWAEEIWDRLGDVGVYAEPFAGSIGVLLASQPHPREIVCDTDGMVCNLWRAVQSQPQETARWADYPTIQQDLMARRYWLRAWRDEHAGQLSQDPHFHCPKAAGWWAWCVSSWIGPVTEMLGATWDKRPHVDDRGGGRGVSVQRLDLMDKIPSIGIKNGGRGVQRHYPPLTDVRPYVGATGSGRGTSAQRKDLNDQVPAVADWPGGRGVQAQRRKGDAGSPLPIGSGERLIPWFRALAQRLSRVDVLNRDWSAAVTPTMLQQTPTAPKPVVGIFLDPPYRRTQRRVLYDSDRTAGDDPAERSYEWALAHGDKYRIAYACRETDFPCPDGWTASEPRGFAGQRLDRQTRTKDVVYYSPACEHAASRLL